ncbi:MAG: VCBS repeat-containing protein [Phycisphaerales bacterium]
MRSVHDTVWVLTSVVIAAPAFAGDWVQFGNETSDRIVADASIGVNDTEEKDYAWGDVDGDGDIDLVVVRKQPFTTPGRRRNVLFLNEGTAEGHAVDGVLVDRTEQYATAADDGGQGFLDLTNDRDVTVVDVNGDSWLDIITAPACNGCPGQPKTITHPRVYINLGNDGVGNWLGFLYEERRIPQLPQSPNFCAVAAGDVTGDGAVDLYFVDYESGLEDRLLINNGTGFFTDESAARMTPAMLSSDFGTHAVIADMNGDGWKDIVKSEDEPVEVFNNAGAGFFDVLDETYDDAAYHVGVGDLNGDGRLDIVISDDGVDRYLLNQEDNGGNGMANFTAFLFPGSTTGFGSNSVIVDLDNDGFNDVIIADVDVDIPGCTRVTDILRNNGNPPDVTFTIDSGGIPDNMLQGVHDVAVIDLNGDCWLDLVIGRCGGTQIWINQASDPACPSCPWDLDGTGSVGASDLLSLLVSWGPCKGCPADFDGNGTVGASDLLALLVNWGPCP